MPQMPNSLQPSTRLNQRMERNAKSNSWRNRGLDSLLEMSQMRKQIQNSNPHMATNCPPRKKHNNTALVVADAQKACCQSSPQPRTTPNSKTASPKAGNKRKRNPQNGIHGIRQRTKPNHRGGAQQKLSSCSSPTLTRTRAFLESLKTTHPEESA